MKKSKIILIAIFVVVALAVLYFAYSTAKKRYFGPKTGGVNVSTDGTQNQPGSQATGADEIQSTEPTTNPDGSVMLQDNGQPIISKSDCDNDCSRLKDNQDYFKYCQEACGDRPVEPKDSEAQCESLAGVDKDACWRDLAVTKKDLAVCDKISDAKLKKVCRNRVTEEILN